MKKKAKLIKLAVVFIFSLFLICMTLYGGEGVSIKNNGDFDRVTRLCSLTKDSNNDLIINLKGESFQENINNIMHYPEDVSAYPSSQLMFVRLSVAVSYSLNILTGNAEYTYNPVCLSLMLAIMYALALTFALMQVNIKNQYFHWLIIGAALIMMCDIGYVSYFNSLYGEGLQHILLIALVGFIIKAWNKNLSILEYGVLTVVLILFGKAKFFNIPLAIIMSVFVFVVSLKHPVNKKGRVIGAVSIIVSALVLINAYTAVPEWIGKETNYNSVFYGVVKDCDDDTAKKYLCDLDLDPSLYVLKNTHHYVSNYMQARETFDVESAEEISKLKLLSFYLKNPLVSWEKVSDIANHSGQIRNIFFMNENYMDDKTNCTLWSKIRDNAGFDTIAVNFTVILLFLALLVYTFLKADIKKYIIAISVMLLFMAFGYSFFIPYVSNGEADLSKHMFLYIELVDICVISIFIMTSLIPKKINAFAYTVVIAAICLNGLIYKKCPEMQFGGYDWYIIEENSDYKTLISKDIVTSRKYSNSNDNLYSKSDIHEWLNNSFIKGFSEEEQTRLYHKQEKIVLSGANLSKSVSGNRDFYCSPYPKRVAANYETAYKEELSGYAFLPTAEHITLMAKKGYKTSLKSKYWLSTPYFNSGEKSRYVNPDGLIYFDYTTEEFGIRPIIYLAE